MRSALAILFLSLVPACPAFAQEDPGGGKPDSAEEERIRKDLDRILREGTNRSKLEKDLAEWKRTGRRPRESGGDGTSGGDSGTSEGGGGGSERDPAARERLDRILREETYEERDREAPPPSEPEFPKPEDGDAGRGRERPPPREISEPRSRPAGGGGSGILWTILILVTAVVLALAIWAFLTWLRERRGAKKGEAAAVAAKKPGAGDGPSAAPPERREPEEWLSEARRLAAAGRHAEALRCLLHASMERLHRARYIDYERARTNRECLRNFRGEAVRRDAFAGVVDAFDLTFYGRRAFGAADYARTEALAVTLAAGGTDESAS